MSVKKALFGSLLLLVLLPIHALFAQNSDPAAGTIYGTVKEDPGMLTILPLPIEGALVTATLKSEIINDSIDFLNGITDASRPPAGQLLAYTDTLGRYVIEGAIMGKE